MSKADKLGASASFGAAGRATSARRQLIAQATGEAPADQNRVPIEQLAGNPENPREDLGDLEELAESLREHGLLQPLSVMPRRAYLDVHPNHADALGSAAFVVVAGNRRLAAARLAGLPTLAVHVRAPEGDLDSSVAIRAAVLAENIHRQDLHPLEEAQEINKLLEHGLNRSEAARILGKSNGWITQRLILLGLHPELQQALKAGELKLGDARELGKLSLDEQLTAWRDREATFYTVKGQDRKEASEHGDGPAASGRSDRTTPVPRKARPTAVKTVQRPEQLTLDLEWGEPEALADQVYAELATGLSPEELRRFADAFLGHL